jgi:hypothetical protein
MKTQCWSNHLIMREKRRFSVRDNRVSSEGKRTDRTAAKLRRCAILIRSPNRLEISFHAGQCSYSKSPSVWATAWASRPSPRVRVYFRQRPVPSGGRFSRANGESRARGSAHKEPVIWANDSYRLATRKLTRSGMIC